MSITSTGRPYGLISLDLETGTTLCRSMFDPKTVPGPTLTPDQAKRALHWARGGGLIQKVLPDLSDGQREMLLTGINEKDWDTITKEPLDDDA